jgi:hypothetical protein
VAYCTALLPRICGERGVERRCHLIVPNGNNPEPEAAAGTLINWLIGQESAGGAGTPATQPRPSPSATCPRGSASSELDGRAPGLDQPAYACCWFATSRTVGLRWR